MSLIDAVVYLRFDTGLTVVLNQTTQEAVLFIPGREAVTIGFDDLEKVIRERAQNREGGNGSKNPS